MNRKDSKLNNNKQKELHLFKKMINYPQVDKINQYLQRLLLQP